MIHAKRLALAWLQSLAELLLYFPFLVALYVVVPHMNPSFPLWLAVLSVFYALGYAFHDAFPSVWRWLALLVPVVVAGGAAWLTPSRTWLVLAVHFILWLLAWIRGRQNRLWGWDNSFPSGLLWIGLIGYFAASFLYPHFFATLPYAPWVTGFGIAALGLSLHRTNALALKSESGEKSGAAKTQTGNVTKWRNRIMIWGLFALILFLAAFRSIAAAARQAGEFLLSGAFELIRKLLRLLDMGEGQPEQQRQQTDISELLGQGEPSAFALFMEKLLYWVVAALLIVAALWLLYVLGKQANRWLKRLLDWYGDRLDGREAAGYTDEKESLMDGREWTRQRTRQWKERLSTLLRKEPGWDELADNRERVRRAYLLLLRGRIAAGYKHDEARTPRETGRELERRAPLGKEETAVFPLYEEVRYGGKDVSDERAAEVKSLFERK